MFNRAMKSTLVLLFFVLLASCSTPFEPRPQTAVERFSVQTVTQVSSVAVMAVSPDGQLVAWGDTHLNLRNLQVAKNSQLNEHPPAALCWSPDGSQLAATFQNDGKSQLNVYDRSGHVVYRHQFPGQVGRLQWPRTGLLTASVLEHQSYSFGAHVTAQLWQWDDNWRITKFPLYETTITPATVNRLSGDLAQSFDFDLSPLTDEVLYTRLHAPPAFAASRRLVLHNLQTGEERTLASLPLLEGGGRLGADGESALIDMNMGQIQRLGTWDEKTLATWPGNRFDYDASSGLLVTETQIFQGERVLVEIPSGSRSVFSRGGKFLLVNWQNRLFLLTGYPVSEAARLPDANLPRILKLRQLRSRGLIEPQEYQQARERLLQ